LLHELWQQEEGLTFCLAGPRGDQARAMLAKDAVLRWTVEAESWFAAMTKFYEYMGWGEYTLESRELDSKTYQKRGWE
jgi:CO/xanthine dehydrogenase FAD-binding subunit